MSESIERNVEKKEETATVRMRSELWITEPDDTVEEETATAVDNEPMLQDMDINEFREHGFLILVNTILHAYGVALTFNPKRPEDGLRPAFCKFRGFPEESMSRMYQGLSEYINENAERLVEESKL